LDFSKALLTVIFHLYLHFNQCRAVRAYIEGGGANGATAPNGATASFPRHGGIQSVKLQK